jgi:hypothetical protein
MLEACESQLNVPICFLYVLWRLGRLGTYLFLPTRHASVHIILVEWKYSSKFQKSLTNWPLNMLEACESQLNVPICFLYLLWRVTKQVIKFCMQTRHASVHIIFLKLNYSSTFKKLVTKWPLNMLEACLWQ